MSNLELLRSLVTPFTQQELEKIAAYEKQVEDDKATIKKKRKEFDDFCQNVPVKNPINFDSSNEEIIAYLATEKRIELHHKEQCRRWEDWKHFIKASEDSLSSFSYRHRVKLLACLDKDKELEDMIRLEGNYFSITYQMLGKVEYRSFDSIHLPRIYSSYEGRYIRSLPCWPVKGGHAIEGTKLDIVKIGK